MIYDSISSYSFKYPFERIRKNSQVVDQLSLLLSKEIDKFITSLRHRLALLTKSIESNDLERSLKKGFALIKQNSNFVTRKKNFNQQLPAVIKFYDGEIKTK